MNYVKLIAATMVDWQTLIQASKQIFGSSPNRELDKHNIALDNPAAYARVIEVMNNRPEAVKDLSKLYRSMDIIHFTFLIKFEDGDLFDSFANLSEICKLTWVQKASKIGLICGTLKQIKDVIEVGCHKDTPEEIRLTCNKMYLFLEQCGFREIFKKQKSCQDDQTFILV